MSKAGACQIHAHHYALEYVEAFRNSAWLCVAVLPQSDLQKGNVRLKDFLVMGVSVQSTESLPSVNPETHVSHAGIAALFQTLLTVQLILDLRMKVVLAQNMSWSRRTWPPSLAKWITST